MGSSTSDTTPHRGIFSLQEQIDQAYAPAALPAGFPPDTAVGDFHAGFDRAPVKLDQHYVLPWYFRRTYGTQCLHGSSPVMRICSSTSVPRSSMRRVQSIAATLQVDLERIHVISPYVGGGVRLKVAGARRKRFSPAVAAQRLQSAGQSSADAPTDR